MEDSVEHEEIDLRNLLSLFIERKWIILCSVFLSLAAAVAYLNYATPLYEATALAEVPEQIINLAKIEDLQAQDLRGGEVLKTIEKNFQGRSLLMRIVERSDLHDFLAKGANAAVPSSKLVEILENSLSIGVKKGTRLIAVTVVHDDPEGAFRLPNGIIEEFIKVQAEVRDSDRRAALEKLEYEMDGSRKRLQESQEALQHLELLGSTFEKIETQKTELNKLKESYLDDHPDVKKAQSGINENYDLLEKQITAAQKVIKSDPKGQSEATREEKLEGEYRQLLSFHPEITVRVSENSTAHDSIIKRKTEIQRLSGLDASPVFLREPAWQPTESVSPKKLQILAAALVFGAALGGFLAWILHLLDNTFRTVDETELLTGHTIFAAIPSDGRLPDNLWLNKPRNRCVDQLIENSTENKGILRAKGNKIEPLVLLSDPGSPVAESFRTLRASITILKQFKEQPINRILVASAIPNEGKSFVATNLATAFSAQEGLRTLLVDADLRDPSASLLFNISNSGPGLSDALIAFAKDNNPSITVTPSGLPNLDLLLAGTLIPNPAELLSSTSMAKLLDHFSEKYDRIIIDSPPVITVSDTLLIAPLVDITVFAVRAGATPRKSVLRALQLLKNAGQSPSGIALNGIQSQSGLASDPYFYHYTEGSEAYRKIYETPPVKGDA